MDLLVVFVLAIAALVVQQILHGRQVDKLFAAVADLQKDSAAIHQKAIAAVYTKSATDEAQAQTLKDRTAADIEILKAEIAKHVPSEYDSSRPPRGMIETPDGRTLMEVL